MKETPPLSSASPAALDALKEQQRQAAARVKSALRELEDAEREFERATRELQTAMQAKTDAA